MDPSYGKRSGRGDKTPVAPASVIDEAVRAATRGSANGGSSFRSNLIILAMIGLLSVLGALAIALRIAFSTLASVTGFVLPPYSFTILFLGTLSIALLFPSATGRTVTAILARRVGFLSLKMDKLDFWNMKAEGIVLESPSMGLVTLQSLSVRPDWVSRSLRLGLSGLKVEISRTLRKSDSAHPQKGKSHRRKSASSSKSGSSSSLSFLSMLRFIRFVQVNIDAVEFVYKTVTIRIRDLTTLLRMGERQRRHQTWEELILTHASLGMLTLTISEEESTGSSPGTTTATHQFDPHNTKDRLVQDEDDLFSETQEMSPPQPLESKSKSFLESRQTTSLRFSTTRLAPLLELNRMSLWIHIPKWVSANDLTTLDATEEAVLPIPGASLSFASIKTSASAHSLFNLFKLGHFASSSPSIPPNPNDVHHVHNAKQREKEHFLVNLLATLGQFRAEPFELNVDQFVADWCDSKGPCLSLNMIAGCTMSTRLGGIRLSLLNPSLTSFPQTSSSSSAETIVSLQALTLELTRAITDIRTSAGLVLDGAQTKLRNLDILALERAHIEFLRLNRQMIKFKRSQQLQGESGTTGSGDQLKHIPPQSVAVQQHTARPMMIDQVEFAVTNGVSMRIVNMDNEPDVSVRLEALGGSCELNSLDGSMKLKVALEDFTGKNGSDLLINLEKISLSAESAPGGVGARSSAKVLVTRLRLNFAAGPVVRMYRLWRRFAPRIAHWKESSQALNLVTDAESLIANKHQQPQLDHLVIGGKANQGVVIETEFSQMDVRLFLKDEKGVALLIPMLAVNKTGKLSTEIQAKDVSVIGFDKKISKDHRNVFIELDSHQTQIGPDLIDVDLNGIRIVVPSKAGPYPGELLTAYFAQRKALLRAIQDVQEELPLAHAFTGPIGSTTGYGVPSGGFLRADSSSLHYQDDSNQSASGGSGTNGTIESCEFAPDVEKLSIRISAKAISLVLEDDQQPDEFRFASQGFFDEKRRRSGSSIFKVTVSDVETSFFLMTAWRSKAGPSSDASLLKRAVSKSQKTRSHLLRILANIDMTACPPNRLERALVHGMCDLVGLEFKSFLIGRVRGDLSDYPRPIFSVDCIDLVSSSSAIMINQQQQNEETANGTSIASKPTRMLFADLRPVPCSTKPILVELSEVDLYAKSSLVGGENDGQVMEELVELEIREDVFRIGSASSFIPMKLYFDFPSATCANLSLTFGENINPALGALDRALIRLLPSSSDTSSPKLGWWDKMRYLSHGRLGLLATGGVEMKWMTGFSPYEENDYVSFSASELILTDAVDEDSIATPIIGVDIRCWEYSLQDLCVRLAKKDCEDGRPVRFLTVPRLKFLLSMAWRARSGGDHYVQLHHGDAEVSDVPDQYSQFRSQALDLGLDFECRRAMGSDYLMKERYPSMELCWRVVYPLICSSIRGMVPPVPLNALNTNPSLGKLLTRVAFNVRADRPHILWWEDRAGSIAVMFRAKNIDSRVVFTREGEVGSTMVAVEAKPKWIHHALLSQFVCTEAYMLNRTKQRPANGDSPLFGDEFGFAEGSYAYGIGLPQEPFYCAPAMRLTLGKWQSLLSVMEDEEEEDDMDRKPFRTGGARVDNHLDHGEEEDVHDSNLAYRLCIDEMRLLWTLAVRDEAFRFFGTISYIIRKEARLFNEIYQKFNSDADSLEFQIPKSQIRRMDLNWLWNRPKPPTQQPSLPIFEKFPEMSVRMANFLSSRMGLTTPICEDKFIENQDGDSFTERPPACSSPQVSADGLKSTWEEVAREFTVELRWPQVSLTSGRSVVTLGMKSATIRIFRLGLLDLDENASLLLRKEMDVEVKDAEMFATALSENSQPGTRFIKSPRPSSEPLCLDPGMEYDAAFVTARGATRKSHVSTHKFSESVSSMLAQGTKGDRDERTIIQEHRLKRIGPMFFDICSNDQDPTLERVGWTDSFHITDIVYTDTTGGAKVPSSHLGMRLQKSFASIKSRDFFAVLVVVRDLLLVGPPADVRELAILTEQEAVEEMRKRTKQAKRKGELVAASTTSTALTGESRDTTMGGVNKEVSSPPRLAGALTSTAPSEATLKLLQAHIEKVLATRGNLPRVSSGSQRIIYELIECDWKLNEAPQLGSILPAAGTTGSSVSSNPRHSQHQSGGAAGAGSGPDSGASVVGGGGGGGTAREARGVVPQSMSAIAASTGSVERLRVQVYNMRGDHIFSVDRSTKVEFEIGELKVLDLFSNQHIFGHELADQNKVSTSRAPFLRADAITSPPIIAYGCRVSVYELLQVHLFPGVKNKFHLRVPQQVAAFIKRYFVDDDSPAPAATALEETFEGDSPASITARAAKSISAERLVRRGDSISAGESIKETSSSMNLRGRGSRELGGGVSTGFDESSSSMSFASSSRGAVLAAHASNESGMTTSTTITTSSYKSQSRIRRVSNAVAKIFHSSSTSSSTAMTSAAAAAAAGGKLDKDMAGSNLHGRMRTVTTGEDDDDDVEQDDGQSDKDGTKEDDIPPSLEQEKEAPNSVGEVGVHRPSNHESSPAQMSTPPGPVGAQQSMTLPPGGDHPDFLSNNDQDSPASNHEALPPTALPHSTKPSAQASSASSSAGSVTIRTGNVVRLSVPKSLQLHPEPTVLPWSSTKQRKSVLSLVMKRTGEPVLEIYNTDWGIKVLRSTLRLSSIYRVQRSKDPTAPPHAIDVYYTMVDTSGNTAGGDGVFTWAAEEPGWAGKDAALPWIAAIAPGLRKNTIETSLQRDLVGEGLESIYRRSLLTMKKDEGITLSQVVGSRRTISAMSTFMEADQLTEDESDNSNSPNIRGTFPDEPKTPRSPANATSNNNGSKQVFFAPDVVSNNSNTLRDGGATNVVDTTKGVLVHAHSQQEQQLFDIAFFKFARIGQIEVSLSFPGYRLSIPFTTTISPTIYHRKLATWYKAFKMAQSHTLRKMVTSFRMTAKRANPREGEGMNQIQQAPDDDDDDDIEMTPSTMAVRKSEESQAAVANPPTSSTSSWGRRKKMTFSTSTATVKKTDSASGGSLLGIRKSEMFSHLPEGAGNAQEKDTEEMVGEGVSFDASSYEMLMGPPRRFT